MLTMQSPNLAGFGRLVRTTAAAFLLIVAVLAMHSVATAVERQHAGVTVAASAHTETYAAAGHVGHSSPQSERSAAQSYAAAPRAAQPGHTADAAVCGASCVDHSGSVGHQLLMGCALALLAAATFFVGPALVATIRTMLATLGRVSLAAFAARPRSRAPSLIVLSISRT